MGRYIGLLASMVAMGCVVGGGEQTHEFRDLEGLRIELSSGDVEIVGEVGRTRLTEVTLDLGGVGEKNVRGELTMGADGWMTIDARGGLLGGGDIEALVPAGLPVEVLLERGDIEIVQPRAGSVSACVAAGSVSIEVPKGGYRLDLEGGAGAVSSEGVWHDPQAPHALDACVGAGDLEVLGTP